MCDILVLAPFPKRKMIEIDYALSSRTHSQRVISPPVPPVQYVHESPRPREQKVSLDESETQSVHDGRISLCSVMKNEVQQEKSGQFSKVLQLKKFFKNVGPVPSSRNNNLQFNHGIDVDPPCRT